MLQIRQLRRVIGCLLVGKNDEIMRIYFLMSTLIQFCVVRDEGRPRSRDRQNGFVILSEAKDLCIAGESKMPRFFASLRMTAGWSGSESRLIGAAETENVGFRTYLAMVPMLINRQKALPPFLTQVLPLRVLRYYQGNLLDPQPTFYLLFSVDGRGNQGKSLVVDEPVEPVSLCKRALCHTRFMFLNSPVQI